MNTQSRLFTRISFFHPIAKAFLNLLAYPATNSNRNKQLGVLVFLTILSLSPFLNKPIHVDDNIYLDFGKRLADIKTIYTVPYYLFGVPHGASEVINASHPPLIPLIDLLLLEAFPNASEFILHCFYLFFAIGAMVFTYFFCVRFSSSPFLVSLSVLYSQPFFIISQSLMTDTAIYCFLFASFVFFIRAVDEGENTCLAAAIVFFSLAIGSGFQSIVFYSVFAVYVYFRPKKIFCFLVMGLSIIPVAVWYIYQTGLVHSAPNPLLHRGLFLDSLGNRLKIIYFVSQFSLAYLAPIGFVFAVWQKKHTIIALVSTILTAGLFAGFFMDLLGDYTVAQKWALSCGAFFSIFGFAMILQNVYIVMTSDQAVKQEKNDAIFLALSMIIFIPICFIFTPFASARYLLPVMTIVYIMILRQTPKLSLAVVTVGICAAMAFGTARADYQLAECYRDAAADMKRLIDPSNHGKVWFNGEWGFRYYMLKEGYHYLAEDSTLDLGDLIIEPAIVARMDFSHVHRSLQLKKSISCTGSFLKTLHFGAHAGFWSQGWGLMPFWPSQQPAEEFKIYEVLE